MREPQQKTRAELVSAIAERTNLSPGQVGRVMNALTEVALEELSPRGPGRVTLPGLLKAEVVSMPARRERAGRNPATGEAITIAARPACERGKIQLRPLKRMRDAL